MVAWLLSTFGFGGPLEKTLEVKPCWSLEYDVVLCGWALRPFVSRGTPLNRLPSLRGWSWLDTETGSARTRTPSALHHTLTLTLGFRSANVK